MMAAGSRRGASRKEIEMPDFTKILRQARKLQSQMQEMQEELARREIEATSGGGMVTAVVNGKKELVSLKIDPQVAGEDLEMLEDLVVAAVNEAMRRADEIIKEEMERITGGLPPGLF